MQHRLARFPQVRSRLCTGSPARVTPNRHCVTGHWSRTPLRSLTPPARRRTGPRDPRGSPLPAFVALVAEPLFLLADAAIVGHLGTAAAGRARHRRGRAPDRRSASSSSSPTAPPPAWPAWSAPATGAAPSPRASTGSGSPSLHRRPRSPLVGVVADRARSSTLFGAGPQVAEHGDDLPADRLPRHHPAAASCSPRPASCAACRTPAPRSCVAVAGNAAQHRPQPAAGLRRSDLGHRRLGARLGARPVASAARCWSPSSSAARGGEGASPAAGPRRHPRGRPRGRRRWSSHPDAAGRRCCSPTYAVALGAGRRRRSTWPPTRSPSRSGASSPSRSTRSPSPRRPSPGGYLGAGDARAPGRSPSRMVWWGCRQRASRPASPSRPTSPFLGPLFTSDPAVQDLLVPGAAGRRGWHSRSPASSSCSTAS